MKSRIFAALARYGYYNAVALAVIAVCGFAHVINAISSTSLFHAVMPVWGITACIAYGLVCFATKKGSALKLLFVAGALTTFWMQ
jgi:hypothetical protein